MVFSSNYVLQLMKFLGVLKTQVGICRGCIHIVKERDEGSMFTCTDWLAFHGLSEPKVKGVILALNAGKIECLPSFFKCR